MLDIGWSELFLIAVLALLVLGPRDLTRLAFRLGHWVGQARQAMGDLRRAFEDMAEELESDQARQEAHQILPSTESSEKKVKPKNARSQKNQKSQKSQKARKQK